MAVRRELVYDERGGFAAADKLTPKKETTQRKARTEHRRGRAVAANPLGEAPAETVAQIPDFYPYFYAAAFSSLCAFA